MWKWICRFKGHKFPDIWRFGPTSVREKTCLRCGFIHRHGQILSGWKALANYEAAEVNRNE